MKRPSLEKAAQVQPSLWAVMYHVSYGGGACDLAVEGELVVVVFRRGAVAAGAERSAENSMKAVEQRKVVQFEGSVSLQVTQMVQFGGSVPQSAPCFPASNSKCSTPHFYIHYHHESPYNQSQPQAMPEKCGRSQGRGVHTIHRNIREFIVQVQIISVLIIAFQSGMAADMIKRGVVQQRVVHKMMSADVYV